MALSTTIMSNRNLRDISVKYIRLIKVDHLQGDPKYSGRTQPKWSVPFDF